MNEIGSLFRDKGFLEVLMDELPCGLFVLDAEGHVRAFNKTVERIFGVNHEEVAGKGVGNALNCLHAFQKSDGCGFIENCKFCEARHLAQNVISSSQKQKTRTYMQLVIDGQVRDVAMLFSAAPFGYRSKSYAVVVIEDLATAGAISQSHREVGFKGIVGRHEKMLELFDTITDAGPSDAPVLIQGESGTGKELVALAIHKESLRAQRHFVPVNCGALPEGLLESEFFGHVKGAFTGATYDKKGRFSIADGGSIFLDEVGELSPAMQVKFLRVLQDGSFEPVGGDHTIKVDVRVLSATNTNLEQKVEDGSFRKDLYYRLCVIPIVVPALRERREDILPLADHFLTQFSEEAWRSKVTLSSNTLSVLEDYEWPGNVRELQNALQYALVKCKGEEIEPWHLPPTIARREQRLFTVRSIEPKLKAKDVAEALKNTGGNKRRTAEMLGVSRSTLYRFLDKQKDHPMSPLDLIPPNTK